MNPLEINDHRYPGGNPDNIRFNKAQLHALRAKFGRLIQISRNTDPVDIRWSAAQQEVLDWIEERTV